MLGLNRVSKLLPKFGRRKRPIAGELSIEDHICGYNRDGQQIPVFSSSFLTAYFAHLPRRMWKLPINTIRAIEKPRLRIKANGRVLVVEYEQLAGLIALIRQRPSCLDDGTKFVLRGILVQKHQLLVEIEMVYP